MILQKAIALIFILFLVCFLAIVIEETFLAGRRRRKLLQRSRQPSPPKPDNSPHG